MKEKRKLFNEKGEPRYIRCYEAKKNPTLDRFTIVFTKAWAFMGKGFVGRVYYVGASEKPAHPQGFYQHGEAWQWEFCSGGSRVAWQDLPEELRETVLDEYCVLWDTEVPV
jgi:hypothetical protein